ncbi:acyl carrier protein [Actinomadura fibrosa]|uniref:Acyl carrier protein n=1 Tax=Actinomadura fibrosa TaxID=111802 RepID=A0ABW2Y535_9ACTN|nr:acyl carrier protein [Actinomadura fibrosa]
MRQFTVDDLERLLRASGGGDEHMDFSEDILDEEFSELGYDSLAILEMSALIKREFGVELADEEVAELQTPRQAIDLVNQRAAEVPIT